jgi:uncharacterized protein YjaG (DUF416 family)
MLKNTLSGKKNSEGNKVSLAIYPFMRVKWEIYALLTTATKKDLLIKKIMKIQSKQLTQRQTNIE